MKNSLLSLPFLLLLAVGCGDSGGTVEGDKAPDKEYTLRIKPTTGAITYDMTIDVVADVSESPNVTDEKAKQEQQEAKIVGKGILEVKEAGPDKLTTSFHMADLKVEHATSLFQALSTLLIGELEKENVTEVTPTGQTVGDGKMPSVFGLNLPDKPVKVGDTWEGKRTGADGQPVVVTGKVMAAESKGGKELLRIELTGFSLSKEVKAKAPMVLLFDPETGLPQEMTQPVAFEVLGMKGQGTIRAKIAP